MMKTQKTLMVFLGSMTAGSLSASAALVAGWETWTGAWPATQTNGTITATAVGTPEAGGTWSNFANGTVANGASSDGSWGTLTSPAANTGVSASTDGITLTNGFDGYIDFTLTDTSGLATDLTSFNFDSGAFRVRAAVNWELSVLPGSSISVGSVASGGPVTVAAAPIVDDYDVNLTGLADSQLDALGTVTFRLNFTGGGAPGTTSSGHHLFLDNVAVFGTPVPVPEPTTSTLFAMVAGCALLKRRRNC